MLWELFVHSPALSRDVILHLAASKHTAELLAFEKVSLWNFILFFKKKYFQLAQNLLKMSKQVSLSREMKLALSKPNWNYVQPYLKGKNLFLHPGTLLLARNTGSKECNHRFSPKKSIKSFLIGCCVLTSSSLLPPSGIMFKRNTHFQSISLGIAMSRFFLKGLQ